jgi:hypothetical protein
MDEPYHRELHEILRRKGWAHQRVNRYDSLSYDHYYDKFNDREIFFYEDDSVQSFESSIKMKIRVFDEVTNNIFTENSL